MGEIAGTSQNFDAWVVGEVGTSARATSGGRASDPDVAVTPKIKKGSEALFASDPFYRR